jgi:5-methylcytosine-specific restriction protein A
MRPCLQARCDKLVKSGYCREHDRERIDSIRQRTVSIADYKTKRWYRLRRLVLTAQPVCSRPGCDRISEEVDHIKPVEDGGPMWEQSNLQALCHSCHSSKTSVDVRRRVF